MGRIGLKPVGSFTYDKALDEEGKEVSCEVTVYPLLVKRQAKAWPEFDQRVTQWVEPGRAAAMVADQELKTLIAAFAKRVAAAASNLLV